MIFSCQRPQPRSLTVSKIKSAAKLATVEVILTKMIIANPKAKGWKKFFGGQNGRFLAETEATVKAGIDLDKIDEGKIKINGKNISLELPPVEILNFSYPAEKFKVNENYTTLTSIPNRDVLEVVDGYYRQSELDIRNNFTLLGINEQAENKTRSFLQKLLSRSGYEEIEIRFSPKASEIKTDGKEGENEDQ